VIAVRAGLDPDHSEASSFVVKAQTWLPRLDRPEIKGIQQSKSAILNLVHMFDSPQSWINPGS
jgi:hypothetical protein